MSGESSGESSRGAAEAVAYPLPHGQMTLLRWVSASHPGFGTVEVTRHHDPAADPVTWVTVDHADPRILVQHELLASASRGECAPHLRVSKTCACSPDVRRLCVHYGDALLEITASNRRFVYIIGRPVFAAFTAWCWAAEWPD